MMIQAEKATWIAALRSKKHTQGKSRLKYLRSDGVTEFCCLGVACELIGKYEWMNDVLGHCFYGPRDNRSESFLPFRAVTGLADSVVIDLQNKYDEGASAHRLNLAGLNDDGFTFDQIADLVERFVPAMEETTDDGKTDRPVLCPDA